MSKLPISYESNNRFYGGINEVNAILKMELSVKLPEHHTGKTVDFHCVYLNEYEDIAYCLMHSDKLDKEDRIPVIYGFYLIRSGKEFKYLIPICHEWDLSEKVIMYWGTHDLKKGETFEYNGHLPSDEDKRALGQHIKRWREIIDAHMKSAYNSTEAHSLIKSRVNKFGELLSCFEDAGVSDPTSFINSAIKSIEARLTQQRINFVLRKQEIFPTCVLFTYYLKTKNGRLSEYDICPMFIPPDMDKNFGGMFELAKQKTGALFFKCRAVMSKM